MTGARDMTHKITLTDDDYATLAAEAAERGKAIDELVHELIAGRLAVRSPKQPTDPLIQAMSRAGHLAQIPSKVIETPESAAERERLARNILPGQAASDMVIEDRGSRE